MMKPMKKPKPLTNEEWWRENGNGVKMTNDNDNESRDGNEEVIIDSNDNDVKMTIMVMKEMTKDEASNDREMTNDNDSNNPILMW